MNSDGAPYRGWGCGAMLAAAQGRYEHRYWLRLWYDESQKCNFQPLKETQITASFM
ncbi:hypothetical protein HMPREF9997_02413 [Corynebacterium durum F0235]|uniref:Uncharacterized protein n=1 Tax=Corynebacterium durum F0235 TaxID=1035195 RepID=L1MAI0_9CORY|nr:hypothetical protein HMPREF9997_02413 [Corynebacterium durum F0235]